MNCATCRHCQPLDNAQGERDGMSCAVLTNPPYTQHPTAPKGNVLEWFHRASVDPRTLEPRRRTGTCPGHQAREAA